VEGALPTNRDKNSARVRGSRASQPGSSWSLVKGDGEGGEGGIKSMAENPNFRAGGEEKIED